MPAAMNRSPKPAKAPELAAAEAAVLRCLAERKCEDAVQVVRESVMPQRNHEETSRCR
jgi:hypothetical protein